MCATMCATRWRTLRALWAAFFAFIHKSFLVFWKIWYYGNMKINLKATNFELTPAIREYVEEKIGGLEKFIHGPDPGLPAGRQAVQAWVEIGLTTRHHQKGDIYRAEIQIRLPRVENGIRTESEQEDLYAAIDDARNEMKLELLKVKGKKRSLALRGARLFKKIVPFLGERKSKNE